MDQSISPQFIKDCQSQAIFNEQDLFLNAIEESHENDISSKIEAGEKLKEIRHPSKNLLEDFLLKRIFTSQSYFNSSLFFTKVGITTPQIVEIIGDKSQGKSLLIQRLINSLPGDNLACLLNNKLNLTKYHKSDLICKTIFNFKELLLFLGKFYKILTKQKVRFPILFIDDFSAIIYDLEHLNFYSLMLVDLIKIFRKIRDECLGTIIVATLPKKSAKDSLPLGSLVPSPWRNCVNRQIYVRKTEKMLNLYVITTLSGKEQFLEIDVEEKN